MNKRLITKKQEQIFRACHHDFEGLSQVEAAKKLGIVQSVVSDALKHVEKIFPNMFPILTKFEMKRYHLYMVEGWSVNEIAEYFEVTPRAIQLALQRAKDKGMFFSEARGCILSYEPSMDANVKQQF